MIFVQLRLALFAILVLAAPTSLVDSQQARRDNGQSQSKDIMDEYDACLIATLFRVALARSSVPIREVGTQGGLSSLEAGTGFGGCGTEPTIADVYKRVQSAF